MSKIDGIQGFSRPRENLAIWAADATHKAHEVRAYLSSLGIWFIPCLGGYHGETEMSYLTTEADFWKIAGRLCGGQETVLLLGEMDSRSRRKATLLYLDGCLRQMTAAVRQEDLGRLYSIPAHDIAAHDSWTIPFQQPNGEILAWVTGHPDKFGDIAT
jgi:hypothetical protein